MLRCVIVAFLGLGPLLSGADEAPLTSFAEVRALSREEAQEQRPVVIEGTVIYFESRKTNLDKPEGMVVDDGTAGCWVQTNDRPFVEREKLKPGARVRITGVTHGLSFYPDINKATVEFLGQGSLPEPRILFSKELFAATLDSKWVQVEAVVAGREPGGVGVTLVMEVDGYVVKAGVPAQADIDERVADLMQRRVKLQGVLGTVLNGDGQMTGRHFLVPSIDHIVLVEDYLLRTKSPPKLIEALLKNDHGFRQAIRIRGVVTQVRRNGFYLRDSTGSAFVRSQSFEYPAGSEVSVLGDASVAPFRPEFRAYQIEWLGESELPPPTPYVPGQGVNVNLHAERVSVEAEFLSRREVLEETILQCRAGGQVFEARLPGPDLYARDLESGDDLRLTGVYEVTTSRPIPRVDWADGFRIYLASDEGIRVLQKAPWWTVERLLLVLGVVLVILLVIVIWNWVLRRQVVVQSNTIVEQVEQGIVKDERQRIARELHDTVEQELTGVSMQLGNLSSAIDEDDEVAGRRLSLARDMLKHCREETRASIRDLRDPHLLDRGLPEAMRESLSGVAEQGALEFYFELAGDARVLQATTEQHLLRMAREAVVNAVRHAEATRVEVWLGYEDDGVTLEVSDDGHGFDATQGPPTGHFGLIGMRERANKIHAKFSIDSSPDAGTKVQVLLPWDSPVALPDSQS